MMLWLKLPCSIRMRSMRHSFRLQTILIPLKAAYVGVRSALTRTVNAYAKSNKLIKDEKQSMSGEDIREGLTAVISVRFGSTV